MARFTQDQLDELLRKNKHITVTDPPNGSSRDAAKLERVVRQVPLATPEAEEKGSGRFLVRFISVRKRLLDPDNISEKWMLDSLRYCRVIPGDEPEKVEVQTTQRKCVKGEVPHTKIEVYEL